MEFPFIEIFYSVVKDPPKEVKFIYLSISKTSHRFNPHFKSSPLTRNS